ncbi:hypothetical protein N9Z13_00460 [Luminiphilus sp.]|nr:hypothetical protein [Luminiphilus sp.]
MKLKTIADTLLNEASSPADLRAALNAFAQLCSGVGGVVPDPSFNAWADDSLLKDGVAISPEAAAHCVSDTQRTVVFIRAAFAAITAAKQRFANSPIEVLYAGCGPFATLLLPLLTKFNPGELVVHLLDIHQRSLDCVALLIGHFDLQEHRISYIQDDACHYQHSSNPHVIITETMQKSLEQEPQFAVTAKLAPQLHARGIFIPQRIEVALCLAKLEEETAAFQRGNAPDPNALAEAGKRHPLATVLCLTPENAATLKQQASQNSHGLLELNPMQVTIPATADLHNFEAVLFTRIRAFEQHWLLDYESEITLPLRCRELTPLQAGDRYRIGLQIGSYPRFSVTRLRDG